MRPAYRQQVLTELAKHQGVGLADVIERVVCWGSQSTVRQASCLPLAPCLHVGGCLPIPHDAQVAKLPSPYRLHS